MIDRIEHYIEQIEIIEGPQPGFRDWLEYADNVCSIFGGFDWQSPGGHLQSRQILALAWASYKLMIHMQSQEPRAERG